MQVIIFPNDGGVAVMFPAPEFEHRMQELGQKDVPAGLPWRIVDFSGLPTAPQESWVWTDDGPLGLGG